MYSLVYVSSATCDFSAEDLQLLLEQSRRNNAQAGVTGMLLYRGGNFIQLLEGEERTVQTMYRKIAADRRHTGLLVLLSSQHDERQFPGWSMGFRELQDADLNAIPGFSDYLNSAAPDRELFAQPSRAQRLLMQFKRNMR